MLAVIGGSGFANLEGLAVRERTRPQTAWGEPSGPISLATVDDITVAFLGRHGEGHVLAPHEINYRANLRALHDLGVDRIIAVAAVGGIREDCATGALVLPDQLIDYTWGRGSTFFEGGRGAVTHVDFTQPYSEALRSALRSAARTCGEALIEPATYGATQGPRLETAAEIRRMARDGCDIVGMTGMPEAVLARELGIAYAALAVVVNAAAGCGESRETISLGAMQATLAGTMRRAQGVIAAVVRATGPGEAAVAASGGEDR
jgi:5'-methylthioadenosine phosphorylase